MPSLCYLFIETSIFQGLFAADAGTHNSVHAHYTFLSRSVKVFYDVIICSGSRLYPVYNPSSFFFRLHTWFILLMMVLSYSNLLMDKGYQHWLGFNLYTGVHSSKQLFYFHTSKQSLMLMIRFMGLHDISNSGAFVGILLAFTTMQTLMEGKLNPADVKSCFIHQVFMLAPWQAAIHKLCNKDSERLTV